MAWCDELVPLDVLETLRFRLVDRNGKLAVTFTPVQGWSPTVADYLNGVDWTGHGEAKQWYSAIKSRPTFRPLLGEKMEGLAPPAHYDKLDF